MKIVIAGGSGQVGNILARHFQRAGQDVVILSRSQSASRWRTVQWDGSTLGPWLRELDGSDVLINLAGRSVNCTLRGIDAKFSTPAFGPRKFSIRQSPRFRIHLRFG